MSETSEQDTTTTPPQIAHEAELSQAGTNPDGSHAVIPNHHAAFLARLAAAVRRGEADAASLARAVERVFGHVTQGGA